MRKPIDRVSIASCSRIGRALENGVNGIANHDARAIMSLVQCCILDPSELCRAMVLDAVLERPSLIQFLEPPHDAWSNV